MEKIQNDELQTICGGGKLLWGILAGLGAIGAFFAGILDGYTNPIACRNR